MARITYQSSRFNATFTCYDVSFSVVLVGCCATIHYTIISFGSSAKYSFTSCNHLFDLSCSFDYTMVAIMELSRSNLFSATIEEDRKVVVVVSKQEQTKHSN